MSRRGFWRVPDWVSDLQEWTAWTLRYKWWFFAAWVALMVLITVIRWRLGHGGLAGSTSWGSARWATRADVRNAGLLEGNGVVFGRWRGQYLRASYGGHTLVCAPSQPKIAGKTRAVIVPTLVTWPGSAIILDVKGELYDLTSAYRASLGPVYRVDTRDYSRDRLNPWDFVRWQTTDEVADLQQLFEHLSAPFAPPTAATEFHRDEGSDTGVTAALYLQTQSKYPRSLGGLRRVYVDPDVPMGEQIKHFEACVDPLVQEGAQTLLNLTPQARAEAWRSARRLVNLWRDPRVAYNTDVSTFDIRTFQHGPTPQTLYLQFTLESIGGHLRALSRLWWQGILNCLVSRKVETYDHQVLIVLDEFAAMGYVAPIETLFQAAAGYGISALAAVQSLGQLWANYGEHTSILNNCATRVFFAQNDRQTAETVSGLLGQTTVADTSRRGPWFVQRGWTEQTHPRPLRTAAEVVSFPATHGVARVPDVPPIWFRKIRVHHWRDGALRRRLGRIVS